jgi:hypothetical protein
MVKYNTVAYNMVGYNAVAYNMVGYNAVAYNMVGYKAVAYIVYDMIVQDGRSHRPKLFMFVQQLKHTCKTVLDE